MRLSKRKLRAVVFGLTFTFILVGIILSKNIQHFQNINNTQCDEFYLTEKANEFKDKVKNIALEEWKFFGEQTIKFGLLVKKGKKETDEGYWQRIGAYWKEGTGFKATGKDTNLPWSAAFISWVMRKADAGNKFVYSIRHSDYITNSIKNRKSNNLNSAFIGYELNEYSPNIGDLVCYTRQDNVDYNTRRRYKSHCDIVIDKQDDRIEVVGGNVLDSVTKKILRVNSDGRLIDTSEKWFVVIKNNWGMSCVNFK